MGGAGLEILVLTTVGNNCFLSLETRKISAERRCDWLFRVHGRSTLYRDLLVSGRPFGVPGTWYQDGYRYRYTGYKFIKKPSLRCAHWYGTRYQVDTMITLLDNKMSQPSLSSCQHYVILLMMSAFSCL